MPPARKRPASARRGRSAAEDLARRARRGDQAALSRALSLVIDESEGYEALARAFFSRHGRSHKIGLCGPPGSGKSSLISRLIGRFRGCRSGDGRGTARRRGCRVGVLAVDPTSPFTGGAFLGDRLRIQRHALDEGVFMRSIASRGMVGGLNATIFAAVHVLEACGFDRILIETVGTGQDEVDIAEVADTVVCVTAPYQGDEFQGMKAGMMEIGDLFAVNKADLDEAGNAAAALREALGLGPTRRPDGCPGGYCWEPQVAAVSSKTGKGVGELCALIDAHRDALRSSGEGLRRRRRQLRKELALTVSRRIYRDIVERITERHIDMLLENKADLLTIGKRLARKGGRDW
ncbi:MAG: methylmalonyl Co-A mutase-associated GTPase MeaB [Elusimicrobiota bacterium]